MSPEFPPNSTGKGARAEAAQTASSPKTSDLASFSRLPDTKSEANIIQEILTKKMDISAKNYQNEKALESVLNAAESPSILHLATHGYFIGKDESKKTTDVNQALLKDSPMFRSGLALAGI